MQFAGEPSAERRQRIVVCDRSGHPFQVQLSRELARRGHHILHLYWSDFLTPHGLLARQGEDPSTFDVVGLSIGEPHTKDSFIKRRRQEKQFGRLAAESTLAFRPDVVLSCNMPLDAQAVLSAECRRHGLKLVFWLQDIYSIATSRILGKKYGIAGRVVGKYYQKLESELLKQSDVVICISSNFVDSVKRWKVPAEKCVVVPNWAPVDEIHAETKKNSWAQRRGLQNKIVVMYSGTLGFKHNAGLIVAAAEYLRDRSDVTFVIVSEGPQAEFIRAMSIKNLLSNIVVYPFEPYDMYSQVLATADVLVAFIDSDAGLYSVPSKVLSYLCAGRPIVLAAPDENLASKTVVEAEAGVVVPADAPSAFARSIADLVNDGARRAALGLSARRYAEERFAIGPIADRFEAILAPAAAVSRRGRSAVWPVGRRQQRSPATTDRRGWSGAARRAP